MMISIKALLNTPRRLKGREKGKRGFILANGPSISEYDLAVLKGEIVIGMNASTILEESHGFVSTYYTISDSRFLKNPEKYGLGTARLNERTIRVLRAELEALDDPGLGDRTFYVKALTRDGFSSNLANGYYYGCTTTMLAMQLAFHLGLVEVYLLGCDLRYSGIQPRFYEEKDVEIEDSFTSVQIMNIARAASVMEASGVRVYGCSPRSFLRPYLRYKSFDDIYFGKKVY
jgi:hypothetical protein